MSSLHVNNQIHSHNTRTNNRMSILGVNKSEKKYCVLHNNVITWIYYLMHLKSTYHFRCSKARYKTFIYKNIRKYWCIYGCSSVIVFLCFEYGTVKYIYIYIYVYIYSGSCLVEINLYNLCLNTFWSTLPGQLSFNAPITS